VCSSDLYLGVKKLSLHQTGFQEVLALAELTGHYPAYVQLIGAQPAVLDDFGGSLTEALHEALEGALELAIITLEAWGIRLVPRDEIASRADLSELGSTPDASLTLARYEAERPSEQRACRHGDARFLQRMSAPDTAGED
jgi:hydrogenase maturation protease